MHSCFNLRLPIAAFAASVLVLFAPTAAYSDETSPLPGTLDDTFAAATNGRVQDLVVQPDGKIVIVGDFTLTGATAKNGVARLNADGSLDTGFMINFPGTSGPTITAYAVALQSDGKILLGGQFTGIGSSTRYRVARLNSDGSLDGSFNPGYIAGVLLAIAVQPDGKILIGGYFSDDKNLRRLNPNGSLDSSFNARTDPPGTVWSIVLQPDGKILIAGDFTTVNGTPRGRFARLQPNGSLDEDFSAGPNSTGADSRVYTAVPLPDGRILLGGMFSTIHGQSRPSLARLDADGFLDDTFLPSLAGPDSTVRCIVLSSGRILVGGTFTSFNDIARGCLALILPDGALDTAFLDAPLTGTGVAHSEDGILAIGEQDDGQLVIGGGFTTFNDEDHPNVARLVSEPPTPSVTSITAIGASATGAPNVEFIVTFSHLVSGVDVSDFTLTSPALTGATITNVTGTGSTYTVAVGTGTGSGALNLNVIDDDSIVSVAHGVPLGGAGMDNGNFAGPEIKIVPPFVRSITRVAPFAPILQDATTEVTYRVRFNEPVTNLDIGDFELITDGGISGQISFLSVKTKEIVEAVDVTVADISGTGILRLGTREDATIEDAAGNAVTTEPFTGSFTYSRLTASTPIAWGSNSEGQLGDGTYHSTRIPTASFTTGALAGKVVVAVSAGERHSVALTADGKVFTWGANRAGVNPVVEDQPIYGLLGHDGGEDDDSPEPVLVGGALAGKTIVAISTGSHHTLALASDGSVFSWGANDEGQIGKGYPERGDNGEWSRQNTPYAIDQNAFGGASIVAIAAGGKHNLALTETGELFAWGYNGMGQLGDGSHQNRRMLPVEVSLPHLTNDDRVISLMAGDSFSVALTADGRIFTCGRNEYGELGQGESGADGLTFAPIALPTGFTGAFVAVACGQDFSLALADDGRVFAWGATNSGEFGNGTEGNAHSAFLLPVDQTGVLGRNVIAVAAGNRHSLALTNNGRVFAWGANSNGMLGDGTDTDRFTPVAVASDGLLAHQNVVALASGPYAFHSLGIIDAELTHVTAKPAAGRYQHGQVLTFAVTFAEAATVTGEPRIALYFDDEEERFASYVSASPDGRTLTFSYTVQHGDAALDLRIAPSIDLNGGAVRDSHGDDLNLFYSAPAIGGIVVDGTPPAVVAINRTTGPSPSTGLHVTSFFVTFTESVYSDGRPLSAADFQITSTSGDVTGIISEVRLVSDDSEGRGDGKPANRIIAFAKRRYGTPRYRVIVTDLSGSGTFRLDLKPNRPIHDEAGNLVASAGFTAGQSYNRFDRSLAFTWGAGESGQLGNGERADLDAPTAIKADGALADQTLVALAHGRDHTLALTADGKVFAWGANDHGQLGIDPENESSAEPIAVDASADNGSALLDAYVIAIAAGNGFSVALTAAGNVITWGRNDHGELGLDRSEPFHSVPSLVSIEFDDEDSGQPRSGDRITLFSDEPERVRIVSIAAGENHVLALTEKGVIAAWGHNDRSQLGYYEDNEKSRSTSAPYAIAPVKTELFQPILAIAAGANHSLAVDFDGIVHAWGANENHQASYYDDDVVQYPQSIGHFEDKTAVDIAGIAASAASSFAIDVKGMVYSWGANEHGQLGREAHAHDAAEPGHVDLPESAVSLATGESHAIALLSDGSLYAWGSNANGQIADLVEPDFDAFTATPELLALPAPEPAVVLGTGPTALHASAIVALEVEEPGPIAATVSLGNLSAAYDGSSHSISVNTSPSGLAVTVTYNGSGTAPTSAGSYAVVATITSAGYTGSTSGTLTIAKANQTIAFPPTSGNLPANQPLTLTATATSALPVTFTRISGPATLTGNNLKFSGAGIVVIRASQAGNANYNAAPDITNNFTAVLTAGRVFFGSATIQSAAVPGRARALADTPAGNVAATVSADGRSGSVLIVSPGAGINELVSFSISQDGTFSLSATQRTGSTTRSVSGNGRLDGDTLSASFPSIGFSFSADVEPLAGPSSGLNGLYVSSALNSGQGTVYSIVGSNNNVLVLVVTPTATVGGSATLNSDGSFDFSATVDGGTLIVAGSLDASTTRLTGSLTLPGLAVVDLAGLNTATPRTDRLINLSSRARVGPGEKLIIAGFVVVGPQPKPVLVRAIGPGLAGSGLSDILANPHIRIVQNNRTISENDDWHTNTNSAALAETFARVGASPLPGDSTDAALLLTLAPGVYAAHVTGSNAAPDGVAIVEIYDASQDPGAETQRLINLSARADVGTGDNLLIGGFVIEGNSPKRVLIRAVGPGLVAGGVTSPLADPVVRLYRGDTPIATNDNWSADAVLAAEISAATTTVNTPPLAAGGKDAALLLTLEPGVYTAHVTGAAGATGTALVEIYEVTE